MTSEWHIRIRVGFILESGGRESILHLYTLRANARMSRAIMESPDIRIEEITLGARQAQNIFLPIKEKK